MTNHFTTRSLKIFLPSIAAILLAAFAAIPAAAQSVNATYAYSINSNDHTISVSKISTATGQVTGISYIPYPGSEAAPLALVLEATPTRNFVYVSDSINNISEFQADRVTGALTLIGSVTAGSFPSGLFVDANNQTLYALNNGDNSVSAFTIGTFGALTPTGTTAAGAGPVSMTMVQGSTQTYAYVVNQNDNSISQYTLCAPPLDCSPLGSLVPGQTFATPGVALQAIAATPGGQSLYVSDQRGAALFAFTIDPATGNLTEPPARFATGAGPQSIAVDLQGQFLYTANIGDSTISAFTIGAGGTLTPIGQNTIVQGNGPVTVTIDPNGQLLYVIDQNSNTEETYGIAPAFEQSTQPNGSLTFVASSNTRSGPSNFALAPAAVLAIPNEYFYATNANSNTISHAPLDPTSGDVGTVVNTPSQVNLPGPVIPDFTGLHIFIDNGTASGAQLTEFTITPSTGAINNSIPAVGAVPLVAGGNAQALDPSGRFLYVTTSVGSAVLLCSVNAGIVGTTCPQAAAAPDAVGVAADPAGAFLYVLGTDGDGDWVVNVYTIDPATGALGQTAGSPYLTGNAAQNGLGVNQQIAVHPSGKFIAVTNGFNSIFTIFVVNGVGGLTKLSDQVEQGGIPQGFLFDATGAHLYEIEGGGTSEINTFQFDSITGAVALAGSAPVGNIPGDAALDTTGQFLLELAVADDANLTGSVAVYPIDPASGAPGEALTVTTLGFNTASIATVAENVAAQFPTVTPIPNDAAFTPTPDNTSATPIDVTVNNFGTAPLSFTSIAILGANPGDFSLGPNTTCALGTPVPAAGSCVLSVIFTPTVVGTRAATLTIIDNANPATQFVPLSGNGTASAATVTLIPNALTFPSTAVGVPSAAMSTTLTNFGNAPLIFTGISIDAGANPGDFSIGPATTCSVQTPVAAGGGTCVLSVIFTPTAAGNRAANLTLADNAAPGTQTLPLTGTGAAALPIVGLNPTTATFPATPLNATSAPITVTVTNTGNVSLNFTLISINAGANPGDFALARGTTCSTDGGVSPAGGSCTLVITFTPTAAGTRSATLTLTDNATPATQTIALTGNGGSGDFTITPPSAPIVVTNGQTTKFPITITPTNGLTPTVTFSASDPIPVGACVFYPQPNPTTVTSAQTFNFLFTTNDPQQGAAPIISPISIAPMTGQRLVQLLLAICLLALVVKLATRKLYPRSFIWTRAVVIIPTLLITFAALTFVGCGGGGNANALVRNASSTSSSQTRGITQPGTYQITIVATTGAITHSTVVTITIH